MNQQEDVREITTLSTLRIIWGAMLMGIMTFGVMTFFFLISSKEAKQDQPQMLMYTSWGMMLIAIPAGYFIRMTIYKKGWQDNRINPANYSTGNIILFATIEGPTFLSLVSTLVYEYWGLHSVPAALGFLLLVINFPTGKPLEANPSEHESTPHVNSKSDHIVSERD